MVTLFTLSGCLNSIWLLIAIILSLFVLVVLILLIVFASAEAIMDWFGL